MTALGNSKRMGSLRGVPSSPRSPKKDAQKMALKIPELQRRHARWHATIVTVLMTALGNSKRMGILRDVPL